MGEKSMPEMRDPVHLIAFGFGSGLLPKAPGSYGTLVGVPIYLLIQPLSTVYYLIILLAAFVLGVWVCGRTSRDLGVHDHGGIVWDEIVGYLVTMTFAPAGWLWLVIGFLLFRLFDIVKPWPIRWIDSKVGGGFGIMLDDLLAGILAAGAVALLDATGWF
ncbi:MAG: phosphatidylglycerophosphatase A [Candidatus Thiodiazotropha sp. (ex Dulcina madagascariensis)]|nr:phosphatidylglycerophosphatase A [Candidatus Thiodiazotropha sp. (ex Epidulcina cf. delphinae)]MCU7921533.1 phosphatidylglycerophosphatase A [Candidatus Thiodiazotropha sp. (ex Dulcina madagascariensis)]MCU7926763.1 phosphatidylglycerophosphatase A [Candidatus Thiodiazotropha sp. (ex Dulcina madagascariensis)]MCU7935731.1 phosphatidylglycerophosphatase A [Candidatus Thiodiazotropha sp. (ex Dulcina madagascariensis)]